MSAVEPIPLRPRLWTVRDVMRECQVFRARAFDLMHAAGPVRLGRSLRVRPEDIDRVLERMREAG